MKGRSGTARRSKLRVIRIVLTEIIIMALGVVCCIMPMPWRLIVPIILGVRSILIKAHLRLKANQGGSKLRAVRIILTEILFMALDVVCCVMPMPWRLVVPIIIGTRSILLKARLYFKENPLPQDEVINIEAEPKKENKRNGRKAKEAESKSEGKAASKKAANGGNKKAA